MRLLLIMPNFFDYPQVIVETLSKMGYNVDFFDDRPSTNSLIKAIIRVNKKLIHKIICNYFDKIMSTVNSKTYDVVFLISGQSLSFDEDMIRQIKTAQPQARFILYQWDSLENFPYIEQMYQFFDKCYSFDKHDVEKHEKLLFLPLFYSERYEQLGKHQTNQFKYDFCFVGTAHPKKYKFINRIASQLQETYPKQFIYFYFPSRLVFFYRKLKNPELRKANYREFHFVPLKEKELDSILDNSRCILDSSQDGQIGLTIRVFEALGAKKKLITTNADVVNYDFYKEENIYVYDGKLDFQSPFFTKPYKEIEPGIYHKYSLQSWLKEIID